MFDIAMLQSQCVLLSAVVLLASLQFIFSAYDLNPLTTVIPTWMLKLTTNQTNEKSKL